MGNPLDDVQMVPMLPCADIDEIAAFWTALGLKVTYRQLRPNPFLALEAGGLALQYYGMPGWDPTLSHSSCGVVVVDTEPLYDNFVTGLRSAYGRVPLAGFPRITRPRRRANNAGLSGFSLIDPAGDWIRVTVRPAAGGGPKVVDDRVEWSTEGGGPVARALENAVVLADSHGDEGRRNACSPVRCVAPPTHPPPRRLRLWRTWSNCGCAWAIPPAPARRRRRWRHSTPLNWHHTTVTRSAPRSSRHGN